MSRLRANSITLHVPASSLEEPAALRILLFNALRVATHRREHALSTQLPHPIARRCAHRNSGVMQNLPHDISDRTPGPRFGRRTIKGTRYGTVTRGAGEPPGHTLRHFCRGGSPNVFETSGQNVFRTLSALGHNATQQTLTKRNNATLTQRRDANTAIGTTEGRRPRRRTQSRQLGRHQKSSLAGSRSPQTLCSANEERIAVTFRQREGVNLAPP